MTLNVLMYNVVVMTALNAAMHQRRLTMLMEERRD